MSSAAGKAVFLSYASQDAGAARRLCEELHATGVEVWFDQSELRGGDAWDAKIRRQIKECALFVPVISRNTQERLEGYYRLEWKLAVDRSHLMAEEKVFFVPVVIDDTLESDAKVPHAFRDVQWTRLPGGIPSADFCARVRMLLGSEASVRPGARPAVSPGDETPRHRSVPVTSAASGHPFRRRVVIAALVAATGTVLFVAQPWQRGSAARFATATPGVKGPQAMEAQRLAELARRHFQGIFTRADLAQAEELGKRASDLEPTLALAWAVRAGANACYLMRRFVAGEAAHQRAGNAQTFAARALAINKEETEALIALGQVATFQGATNQAEAYYRKVIRNEPENSFARRYLSIVLRSTGRPGEAIELMEESVKRFPRDTLSHFDRALAYAYGWNWARAWDAADAALAIEPFPGALMLKVRLAFQWKGDVALMRELLNQLDLTYRNEDDAVVWEMRCGLFERKPDRVLEAAGRTARTYLEESFIFPAPKAWFTAQAYGLAGKTGLARTEWQAAAAILRERLTADPQDLDLRLKLAVTLAWMNETGAAQDELRLVESAWREQLNPDRAWDLASFHAASGDAAAAVPLLREALHRGTGIAPLTVHQLKLDPWWDRIRGTPEFQALIANPPPLPRPIEARSR